MKDIEQFVRELNQTWLEQRYDDLYEFFDEGVALLPPGATAAIVGVEAMVSGYREFGSMGTIHAFDVAEIEIHDFDRVAICHLRFEVDYEIESGRFRETGVEIYAIDKGGETPRIVWRTQVSLS